MSGEKLFISLVCPSCGGDLCGGDAARIHLCFECRKAYVMDEFPRNLPLMVLKPRVAHGEELFYMPFFKINGDFSFTTQDAQKTRTYRNMNPLGAIYYPAFPNIRSLYSEDLTIRYSLGIGEIDLESESRKAPMVDGARNPVHLETIGKLVWLGYMDKVADVTDVKAQYAVSSVSYCLVPFEKTADGPRELMLGLTLRGFVEIAANG